MPISTKKQRKPIARETLELLASTHTEMADGLLWVVGRSLQCLNARLAGQNDGVEVAADWPSEQELFLQRIAMARTRAEVRVEDDPDAQGTAAGAPEDELLCLLDTLVNVAKVLNDKASTASAIAKSVRRGQPKKQVWHGRPNALVRLAGYEIAPQKKKPGRPTLVDISDDDLLAQVHEGKTRGDASQRATLKIVATKNLQEKNMHTAGDRVQQRVLNLEKRASEAKKRLRN
jgi:hypothetical protein